MFQLADRLGRAGHDVDVITSTRDAANAAAFHVRPLRLLQMPVTHVVVSPFILGALRQDLSRGYDVVHAHVSVVSPVGYSAAAVARGDIESFKANLRAASPAVGQ